MSLEVTQALQAELGRDERLLWSGMPRQGVRLSSGDALMVPFSLLWGGFAIFWEYSVVSRGAPLVFTLFGVPFVLIGLYMIVGRFFVDSYRRARTYYGVTDQRVIILSGLMKREVKSLNLVGLNDLSLSERSDRSGTITFGSTSPVYAMWSGTGWPGMGNRLPPAFNFIDDARTVYDLIREAQREGSGRRGP
jgi:hypothetical protein